MRNCNESSKLTAVVIVKLVGLFYVQYLLLVSTTQNLIMGCKYKYKHGEFKNLIT